MGLLWGGGEGAPVVVGGRRDKLAGHKVHKVFRLGLDLMHDLFGFGLQPRLFAGEMKGAVFLSFINCLLSY